MRSYTPTRNPVTWVVWAVFTVAALLHWTRARFFDLLGFPPGTTSFKQVAPAPKGSSSSSAASIPGVAPGSSSGSSSSSSDTLGPAAGPASATAVTDLIMAQALPTRTSPYDVPRTVWRVPIAGSLSDLELRNEYLAPPRAGTLRIQAAAAGAAADAAHEPVPNHGHHGHHDHGQDRGQGLDAESVVLEHHQVQVRVRAVGLNFADIFAVTGLYSATPTGSFIPGLEFSGEVIAVPPPPRPAFVMTSPKGVAPRQEEFKTHDTAHACPFAVGDRVMGVTRFGGFASVINADTRCLRPLPHNWTFAEGASFLAQGLTAAYGLHRIARVRRGDTVLVHSAAGGVGLFCLELCKAAGADVIATVGSAKKANFLIRHHPHLSVRQVIDRSLCGHMDRPLWAAAIAALAQQRGALLGRTQFQQATAGDAPRKSLVGSLATGASSTSSSSTRWQPPPRVSLALVSTMHTVLSALSFVLTPIADVLSRALCSRAREAADYEVMLERALGAIEAKRASSTGASFASSQLNDLSATSVATIVRSTGVETTGDKLRSAAEATQHTLQALEHQREMHIVGYVPPPPKVDVSMDSLMGPYFEPTMRHMAGEGRVVCFGAGSFTTPTDEPDYVSLAWRYLNRPKVDPLDLVPNNVQVAGFNLIWLWEKLEEISPLLDILTSACQTPPHVGKVFKWPDLPQALRFLQSGLSTGKVVVLLPTDAAGSSTSATSSSISSSLPSSASSSASSSAASSAHHRAGPAVGRATLVR